MWMILEITIKSTVTMPLNYNYSKAKKKQEIAYRREIKNLI